MLPVMVDWFQVAVGNVKPVTVFLLYYPKQDTTSTEAISSGPARASVTAVLVVFVVIALVIGVVVIAVVLRERKRRKRAL